MTPLYRFTLCTLLACVPAVAAPFRAAAAKADITPQSSQWLMGYNARKSTGVHDHIYHRVVAMEAGGQQFYLVASDLCLFSPGVYDDVARDLERETGITRAQFWWSVTHSHAAPEVGPPGMYKALLGRSDHEYDREYAALVKDSLIAPSRRPARNSNRRASLSGRGSRWRISTAAPRTSTGRCRWGSIPRSGGPADRTHPPGTAGRRIDRAGRQLCDPRHGHERAESPDQRGCSRGRSAPIWSRRWARRCCS